MNHKFATYILSLVLVGTLAIGGTYAIFSDQGGGTAVINAGTLDLQVNGSNSQASVTLSNMYPNCAEQTFQWNLKNVGTVNGVINSVTVTTTQSGGAYTDAEGRAGDTTNAGNLYDYIYAEAYVNGLRVAHGNLIALSSGGTVTLNLASMGVSIPLAAGAEVPINIKFTWPSTATDNMAQGDTMTLAAVFNLDQQ